MILASAQISSVGKNMDANIQEHLKWIKIAARYNAKLIAFPEMSLTGYMRQNASNFALAIDDMFLLPLKELAILNGLIIIAGAPVINQGQLYIGSFIIYPDGDLSIYTKQYLHPGEELFFNSSFNFNPLITIGQTQISLAICADIDHPSHARNAAQLGSSVYIPSIFFSKGGISDAYQKLSSYSKDYSINILMSNFCGECWETLSGGKSAFWSDKGELIASLDDINPGLLIIEKEKEVWQGKVIRE